MVLVHKMLNGGVCCSQPLGVEKLGNHPLKLRHIERNMVMSATVQASFERLAQLPIRVVFSQEKEGSFPISPQKESDAMRPPPLPARPPKNDCVKGKAPPISSRPDPFKTNEWAVQLGGGSTQPQPEVGGKHFPNKERALPPLPESSSQQSTQKGCEVKKPDRLGPPVPPRPPEFHRLFPNEWGALLRIPAGQPQPEVGGKHFPNEGRALPEVPKSPSQLSIQKNCLPVKEGCMKRAARAIRAFVVQLFIKIKAFFERIFSCFGSVKEIRIGKNVVNFKEGKEAKDKPVYEKGEAIKFKIENEEVKEAIQTVREVGGQAMQALGTVTALAEGRIPQSDEGFKLDIDIPPPPPAPPPPLNEPARKRIWGKVKVAEEQRGIEIKKMVPKQELSHIDLLRGVLGKKRAEAGFTDDREDSDSSDDFEVTFVDQDDNLTKVKIGTKSESLEIRCDTPVEYTGLRRKVVVENCGPMDKETLEKAKNGLKHHDKKLNEAPKEDKEVTILDVMLKAFKNWPGQS